MPTNMLISQVKCQLGEVMMHVGDVVTAFGSEPLSLTPFMLHIVITFKMTTDGAFH